MDAEQQPCGWHIAVLSCHFTGMGGRVGLVGGTLRGKAEQYGRQTLGTAVDCLYAEPLQGGRVYVWSFLIDYVFYNTYQCIN